MNLFGWTEMLLKNSKAVISIIAVVISGFGFGSWTIYDQSNEIAALKAVPVVVETDPLKSLTSRVSKAEKQIINLNKQH